jgi:guanosine-3',5'-bis(diphosphate) 3'-pyrophosphohydrolase
MMTTLVTKHRFDTNNRHKSSRVTHLEHQLSILGFTESLRALDLVLSEMNAENGFKRHDGFHYYYHLVDVAQILLNFGIKDQDIITAALLHDFVEDVKWATYEYVQDQFNARVADIVLLLTKKKGVDYKEDLDEMQRYLSGIAGRCESALIKTADRIHNFSSMLNSSKNHRMKQVKETRDFYIPFFKECRNRYVRYSNFFFFAKTTIEPILHEIDQSIAKTEELENEIKRLKAELKAK